MASKCVPVFQLFRFEWMFHLNSTLKYSLSKHIRTLRTDANIISCEKNIEIERADGVTIPELLRSNLHKWEKDKAFDCAITGRTYTHKEIFSKALSFATALKQCGLKRNDVVGILLPNIPEYAIVYLGIWDAGLIASPANNIYGPGEIAEQMLSCEAKAIVTVSEMADTIKNGKKLRPKLTSIIVIGEPQPDCHSFYEMLKVDTTGSDFFKGSDISNDDIALIPYSSGTTGPPKGVMLTHKNIVTNLLQFSSPDFHAVNFNEGGNSQDRLIAVLPFFHIYGLSVILASTLFQGHFTSCLPKFEPQSFVELLKKHKPTCLHLAPPLFSFMVQRNDIGRKETEYLRAVISGAAPLGHTLIKNVFNKFGTHIFLQEGFGMTELSPVSHIIRRSAKNSKLSSVGSIVPSTLCKVVSVDTGKALDHDQRGELCIKGPQVMKGYFGNEKATKETIDSEGWLHTGDIAYYDTDECFYIVDRMKELIKVKGFQVAPAELENILRKHPAINDVAVIGVPNERTGESPRAYVVKKKNHSVSEVEIKEYLDSRVAKYKHLNGGVQFMDAIPKASSGKILRKELQANFLKYGQ